MGASGSKFIDQAVERLTAQDSCSPEGLRPILDILPHIAVFSPNLLEMQSILSQATSETPEAVVQAARHFEDLALSHIGRCHTAIIVRAGPLGSFTLSASWTGWVPAFWGADRQDQVADVTGGGNAWLGGFCAGLLLTNGNMRSGGSSSPSTLLLQR
jgi:sugar/nucleoside kinase (ribokinase family)